MIHDSDPPRQSAAFDAPAEYTIRVHGWLDPNWFEFHNELSITVSAAPNQLAETLLHGKVSDQSDLLGILTTLNHFGLMLVQVQLVKPEIAASDSIKTFPT